MAQLNPVNFEDIIDDDVLSIIISHISSIEVHPLMEVNARWRDVCLQQLRTRTTLQCNFRILDAEEKSIYSKLISKTLELMTGLKSFQFNLIWTMSDCPLLMDILETIIDYNPQIEELNLYSVDDMCFAKIQKLGLKIKILKLSYAHLYNQTGESLFGGFRIIEYLELSNCSVNFEMLETFPQTLKKLSLKDYSKDWILGAMKVLTRSNLSSIEYLNVDKINLESFGLIVEHFKNLKSFEFKSEEYFDSHNLAELKHLKKLSANCFRYGN